MDLVSAISNDMPKQFCSSGVRSRSLLRGWGGLVQTGGGSMIFMQGKRGEGT